MKKQGEIRVVDRYEADVVNKTKTRTEAKPN